jgi:hypothetical protein
MGDKTECSNYQGILLLPTSYKILSYILLSRLIPCADEIIGDDQCAFRRIGQREIRSSISVIFWRKSGSIMVQYITICRLKKDYDTVRREILLNIVIEFVISEKVAGLIKICLNETNCRVHIGKNMSENFTVQNGLKQGDASSLLLFNFDLVYAITHVKEKQE